MPISREVILMEPQSQQPQEKDLGPELSDAELKTATSLTGMMILDRRRIKGFAKIGKFLKREGLVEVARGKLAGRQDALERARAVMMDLIEDRVVMMGLNEKERPVVHHEVVLAATNALVAIVNKENDCDALDLDLEKKLGSTALAQAPGNKLPPDEMGYEAIEVNSTLVTPAI